MRFSPIKKSCLRGHGHKDCDTMCVICGITDCGGVGRFVCHADSDVTPVCKGKCFAEYNRRKAANAIEELWNSALKRWGAVT